MTFEISVGIFVVSLSYCSLDIVTLILMSVVTEKKETDKSVIVGLDVKL